MDKYTQQKFRNIMNNNHYYHKKLSEYFSRCTLGHRKIKELPWQLSKTKEWNKLSHVYSDLSFFHLAWRYDRFETKMFWSGIEQGGGAHITDAYKPFISDPTDEQIGFSGDIVELFTETGHTYDAIPLLEFRVQYFRKERLFFQLIGCLEEYATALKETGELEPALTIYREQEQVALETRQQQKYCSALGNQAAMLILHSNFDLALTLLKDMEKFYSSIPDRYNLCVSFNNQSLICRYCGDHATAAVFLDRFEIMAQGIDKELQCACEFNKGVLLSDEGHYTRARGNFESACKQFTLTGNENRIALAYGNLSVIARQCKEYSRALEYLDRQESTCIKTHDKVMLVSCWCNKAIVLTDMVQLDNASELLHKAEVLARKLNLQEGVCRSLIYQAGLIIIANGLTRKAKALLTEATEIIASTNLVFLKRITNDLLNTNEYDKRSYFDIPGWISPLILTSSHSFKGMPGKIQVESMNVVPDWTLKSEAEIHLFLTKGGNPDLYDKDSGTALMSAVSLKSEHLVNELLQCKANVNARDNDGVSALMIASKTGAINITNLLLKSGAEINSQKNSGMTPLIAAIEICNLELVRLLLTHGADPNLKMRSGYTPLILAIEQCQPEIIKMLLEYGANPHVALENGRTALEIANEKCPSVYILLVNQQK
jgi:tetratricopeptide (TPR) repeat protein